MLRQMLVGFALTAVTVTSASAQAPPAQPPATQDLPALPESVQLPNLTGTWRLDRARSDTPARLGQGEAREGSHGGRGRGGRGGFGSRPGDGGALGEGMRRTRLPDVLHIEQTAHSLRLADTTGTVLQVIAFGAELEASSAQAAESKEPVAAWIGTRLQVQRSRSSGVEVTDSYWLEDDGRTLKVRTVIESRGSTPSGIHTRVYTRAGGS